jgi:hypothetical protein
MLATDFPELDRPVGRLFHFVAISILGLLEVGILLSVAPSRRQPDDYAIWAVDFHRRSQIASTDIGGLWCASCSFGVPPAHAVWVSRRQR